MEKEEPRTQTGVERVYGEMVTHAERESVGARDGNS
jgi:hypothetical protein